MSGRRGSRGPFFDFGGLGDHQSLLSSVFGGQDPFDDPFFTPPFGGMFESSFSGPIGSHLMNARPFGLSTGSLLMNSLPIGFSAGNSLMNAIPSGFATRSNASDFATSSDPSGFVQQPSLTNRPRGPIIEELNSDDEKELEGKEEKEENPRKHGRSSTGPYVEDPDDEIEERKSKQMMYMNGPNSNKHMNGPNSNKQLHGQSRSFSFHSSSSSVAYGGSNGAYYTSSRTMRTGSDGLTIEESKEADSTTGRAAHRLSRGIHDKGHTVTRNLNSDGRVDTMQILQNINEDELSSFDEAWNGSASRHLPGWSGGLNMQNGSGRSAQIRPQSRGDLALPSTEGTHVSGSMQPDVGGSSRSQHSGRMKTNNRGRSRGSLASNRDHVRRHE